VAGALRLDLLPDFFFASNFFSPELESSEGKILKRNPAQEKKGGSGSGIGHLQLPIGRWMNFLETNHDQTPYLDAHSALLVT
jgi:hypothetical protein